MPQTCGTNIRRRTDFGKLLHGLSAAEHLAMFYSNFLKGCANRPVRLCGDTGVGKDHVIFGEMILHELRDFWQLIFKVRKAQRRADRAEELALDR